MENILAPLVVVALGTAHAFLESRSYQRSTAGEPAGALDSWPPDATWVAGVLGFLVLMFWMVRAAFLEVSGAFWSPLAGAVLAAPFFLLGTGFRCLAIESLPAEFGFPPFRHHPDNLQLTGIFAIIRHPSETGLLLMSAALIAIAPDRFSVLWTAMFILPLSIARMSREENWLVAKFGSEYNAYCMRVPALVPHRQGVRQAFALVCGMIASWTAGFE